MQWDIVIGLEIHVQLATQTKIFSGSSTAFGAEPNTQANAVDLACWHFAGTERERLRQRSCSAWRQCRIRRRSMLERKTTSTRPAQGLPDHPANSPSSARAAWISTFRAQDQTGPHSPRPPERRCRSTTPRGLPRHVRHRPEPRRHAADRGGDGTGHEQRRGSRPCELHSIGLRWVFATAICPRGPCVST